MPKKNNLLQNRPALRVISGDLNSESFGLGDPCVPIELSYFHEENPIPCASLNEVDILDD